MYDRFTVHLLIIFQLLPALPSYERFVNILQSSMP
jgi:hypothetical protein